METARPMTGAIKRVLFRVGVSGGIIAAIVACEIIILAPSSYLPTLLLAAWRIVLGWNSATSYSTVQDILTPVVTLVVIYRKRLGAWRVPDFKQAVITTAWGVAVMAGLTAGAWIVAVPVAAWNWYAYNQTLNQKALEVLARALHRAQDRKMAMTDEKPLAALKPYTDTRLLCTLTPSGSKDSKIPVTGIVMVLQDTGRVGDGHVYVRLFLPSKVTDVKIDSPRVQLVAGGSGGTGPGGSAAVELSAPELAPHESRIIRISVEGVDSGDVRFNMSSDRCGDRCPNVAIIRPSIGEEVHLPEGER
jgi:hypothetical protein